MIFIYAYHNKIDGVLVCLVFPPHHIDVVNNDNKRWFCCVITYFTLNPLQETKENSTMILENAIVVSSVSYSHNKIAHTRNLSHVWPASSTPFAPAIPKTSTSAPYLILPEPAAVPLCAWKESDRKPWQKGLLSYYSRYQDGVPQVPPPRKTLFDLFGLSSLGPPETICDLPEI